ncbi:1-phosphofructokinase family hexose kinase [Stackebrandtia soli]|uniref:1-phosphofructokinase family hexose kinase n=1 Tax=Stackebrandtia soli TaxID=1892856 RepID=UPI0039EB1304
MILAVSLNPALDVTYHIDETIRPHATHRVRRVDVAAGGKALNVARVLDTLGTRVTVTGLLGGTNGDKITAALPATVPHTFVPIDGESRATIVVADGTDATGFFEAGPTITAAAWAGLRRRVAGFLPVANVVVLSGSMPPGLSTDAYAELVRASVEHGRYTVLDADGEALTAALRHHPDVIKPNTAELAAAVPELDTSTIDGAFAAADRLREAGARAVVASRGADGLIAVAEDGTRWQATLGEALAGNPTGAGDACVAGLVRGVQYGYDWPGRLREAVALSAAAVLSPVAGAVDVHDYLRFRRRVTVTERPPP